LEVRGLATASESASSGNHRGSCAAGLSRGIVGGRDAFGVILATARSNRSGWNVMKAALVALWVVRASEAVQILVGVGTAGLSVGNGMVNTTLFVIDVSQVATSTASHLRGVVLVSSTTSSSLGVNEFAVAADIGAGKGVDGLITTASINAGVVGLGATARGEAGRGSSREH